MTQNLNPRTAWERYTPTYAVPWNLKRAGHLLRRATFGASWDELQTALRDGPERTITALLQGREDRDANALWVSMSRSLAGTNTTPDAQNNGGQISALWLYRMLYSGHPLREKLTLFWHNHFATSNQKVRNVGYMLGQYELLRRHAQGNFRTLLNEMSSDPAMLVWLDNALSRRDRPNENYARELMELFSLGIHNARRPSERNYTEQDIREAARAFTGWKIENGRGVFNQRDHDDTEKTVIGQRGRWGANDVVRICLEQESAAYFITRKLFRFLISDEIPPTPELLEPLATEFRREYNFGALVERMLRSNLFFSDAAYRTKVKAPIDFVLGMVRGLEGHRAGEGQSGVGTTELARALEGLGQRLFYPPSVAGWDGGRAWLNGQTFLFRQNLALALTSTADSRFARRADPARLVSRHDARTSEQQVDFLLRLFLQGDVPTAARDRLMQYANNRAGQSYPAFWTAEDIANHRTRTLCHLVLCMPEYQLD